MKSIFRAWNKLSLIVQIIIGLVIGISLAVIAPKQLAFLTLFGDLFVGALKAIAPLMVFILVMAAIAQHKSGTKTNMSTVIVLYIVGTLSAGLCAVVASFLFPQTLILAKSAEKVAAPDNIISVLKTVLLNAIDNPINAIVNTNFLGVLAWAIIIGVALRSASESTKDLLSDLSDAITKCVRWIIQFAPIGVMGLVFNSISTSGIGALAKYASLILLLVGTMVFIALVVNPLIVFLASHQNPYPLVFKCLSNSGITAFFTRSSAANIPVNLELCEDLGLDVNTYPISIPLGATINMAGAAVTIAVMSLAACNTMGVKVDIPSAILLIFLTAISAAGASGVAGGSLLLIPLACSLFGLPADISMQVVGVGFICGVIQDSCETALNSSTDVLLTATAELHEYRKRGEKKVLNIK